jgi:C1A family cysteine protease
MSIRQVIVATIVASALAANVHDRSYYEAKFFGWMAEHNIKAESGAQFAQMIQNFANNDDLIEKHNSEKNTYTLGHNKFSHMSSDEWKAYVRGVNGEVPNAPGTFTHNAPRDVSTLAASVDWVAGGAVSDVKDQGQCGSCWAFSTVGSLEGAYKIKNGNVDGKIQTFSEQNLVSCDNRSTGGSDLGCKGGLMDSAFEWTKKNGGICTEDAYPYVSGKSKKNEDCLQSSCTKVAGVAPSSWTDVKANDDAAMMSAIAVGPVSVAIEADEPAFQLYKSGVFTGKCGTNLDHGVLATGYGVDSESGLEFYSVKNSWGDGWGEKGYIRFVKGSGVQKEGQCGILMQASYPKL